MSRDVRIPVMLRTRKFIFARFMKGLKSAEKSPGLSRYFLSIPSKSPSWMVFIVMLIFLTSMSAGEKRGELSQPMREEHRAATGRICDWPMGDEHRAAIVICNWPMGEEHSATAWDLWLAKEIWAQRNYSGLCLTNGRRAQRNFRDLWLTNERTAQGWL